MDTSIYAIILGLFSTFIMYRFMNRMLHRRYPAVYVFLIMFFWYHIESYININMGLYKSFPQLLFFFLNDLAIAFFLFENSKGKKFLTALFLQPGLISLSAFVFVPFLCYFGYLTDLPEVYQIYAKLCDVLIFLFSALVLEIVGRSFKNLYGNMPFDCCLYLFVLVFFLAQSISFICEMLQQNYRDRFSVMCLASLCGLTGIGLIIFSIYYVDKRLSLTLSKQQNLLLNKHIDSLTLNEEAVASFRHDIKNHFICLKNLLDSGHIKEAGDYLEDLTKTGKMAASLPSSGNLYVDAVLQEKKLLADREGVDLDIDLLLPPELSDRSFDLCIALSNALDNAIEACKSVIDTDVSRKITVSSYTKQRHLILELSNPYVNSLDISGGRIHTTKPDSSSHGIGLFNMQAAVSRCRGDLQISIDQNRFLVSIILPF